MATTRTARKSTARKSTARKSPRTTTARTAKATVRTATGNARKTTARKAAKVTKAAKRVAKPTAAPRRRASSANGHDAIALLKQDHRDVEQVFRRFEKAGDGAVTAKRQLVATMITMLSQHAEIEELVFYPAVRGEVPGASPDVLEALEEHHVVKLLLRELEDLDPREERFDAKVTVMMENVRHHVREEEGELFPEVRKALGRRTLLELGDALRSAKPRVPTRPHPGAPDTPPANAIVSGAVAAVDRARTAGKRAIERVREELPTP